jgi:hypothetical protein
LEADENGSFGVVKDGKCVFLVHFKPGKSNEVPRVYPEPILRGIVSQATSIKTHEATVQTLDFLDS